MPPNMPPEFQATGQLSLIRRADLLPTPNQYSPSKRTAPSSFPADLMASYHHELSLRESTIRIVLTLMSAITFAMLTPTSHAAGSFRDCADCPLMVTVPAGSFAMGSTDEQINWAVGLGAKSEDIQDETPQHQVNVQQFSMAVTEVTRDQFDAFVKATGHQAGGPCWVWSKAEGKFVESAANDWRDPGFAQGGNHPVVCVNWNDAKAYVRWLSQKTGKGYRLPTESEWEYAARAGTDTGRYWGWENRDACQYANVADQTAASALNWDAKNEKQVFPCTDGNVYTASVAQFRANGFGLNDMMGNVWEWTDDCYNILYNGAPTNGSAWLTGDCSLRVVRGGGWGNHPWEVRSANRVWDDATRRFIDLGFRVARTN